MGLGDCFKCIKYLLFVFNLIFCLIGLAILAFGILIYVAPHVAGENVPPEVVQYAYVFGIVLIVIGSIITILGFLGCCGAIFENRVLLVLFFVVLLLIFLCLLAIGILAVVYKDAYRHQLAKQFDEGINAADNSTQRNWVDVTQEQWHCCGWEDAKKEYNNMYPPSCHYNATATKPLVSCSTRLRDYEAQYGLWSIVATFVTAAVAFLGLIFSMMLCCAITDLS